jgi:hypothetical protein
LSCISGTITEEALLELPWWTVSYSGIWVTRCSGGAV